MTDLTDKERYLIELEFIAGSYNGLREFNALSKEDYLQIGYYYIRYNPDAFLEWCKDSDLLCDILLPVNDLSMGEEPLDSLTFLKNNYNYWLKRFVKNNHYIEFDYDQTKAEAYEEFKQHPQEIDDIGD